MHFLCLDNCKMEALERYLTSTLNHHLFHSSDPKTWFHRNPKSTPSAKNALGFFLLSIVYLSRPQEPPNILLQRQSYTSKIQENISGCVTWANVGLHSANWMVFHENFDWLTRPETWHQFARRESHKRARGSLQCLVLKDNLGGEDRCFWEYRKALLLLGSKILQKR